MPKATRFTRRKSHSAKVETIDDNNANITFEQFRTLAVVSTFSKNSSKNERMTFRPEDYARFLGDVLEGRVDEAEPYEYWVGKIKEIRRSKTTPGFWLHVQWLWTAKEMKDLGAKNTSHMGKWERAFCTSPTKSETVVHSDTIEAPTDVYVFDEHTYTIPDSDAFYVRSMFNYTQKTLTYLDTVNECKCSECDIVYNPDDSRKRPLRYCATCRVWCHTLCGKSSERRLVQATEFTNPQHFGKGLLLSGPAGDLTRPGPKSKKAHGVAERAAHLNLTLVTKRVPKEMQTTLIAIAQSRISRPLNGNVAGNKSYVIRAREWIREARTPGSWSKDRAKKLQEWFEELTQEITVEELTAADGRKDAQNSTLFVCNECGYPV